MDFGLVLVTASSAEEAEAIAQVLIEKRLAACVTLLPVQSLYRWQGKLERSQEYQLLIKTDLAQFTELVTQVQAIHSYEVPEIIAVPILQGSPAYLAWLQSSLSPDTP